MPNNSHFAEFAKPAFFSDRQKGGELCSKFSSEREILAREEGNMDQCYINSEDILIKTILPMPAYPWHANAVKDTIDFIRDDARILKA